MELLNKYDDLFRRVNGPHVPINGDDLKLLYDLMFAVKNLIQENATLKNELCMKCGKYKQAHKGSCDGCRWRDS